MKPFLPNYCGLPAFLDRAMEAIPTIIKTTAKEFIPNPATRFRLRTARIAATTKSAIPTSRIVDGVKVLPPL
jgi:hypothetical protein